MNTHLDDLPAGENQESAAHQLRKALDATLDRLLRSRSRVAVLTGGGLDSGGLLALTQAWARRQGKSCFAVAMDFAALGDDRPFLLALSEKLEVSVIRVSPEDGVAYKRVFYEGIDHAPQPWPTAMIELAAYARAKAEGADCILTGVGGDQMFDGEARALGSLARHHGPVTAWRSARRLRGFRRPRSPYFSWVIRPFVAGLIPRSLRARIARTAPIVVEPWAGSVARACIESEKKHRRIRLCADLLSQKCVLADFGALNRTAARHRQQVEVAIGIHRLDPFLDPSLQAFRRRLDPHWLLAGDIRRGLFREALRDLLPSALYSRESKARFEPAQLRFVEAAWRGFAPLRELAKVPTLAALGVINPTPFGAAFEKLASDPSVGPQWPRVWPVLALEAFAQHHFGNGR